MSLHLHTGPPESEPAPQQDTLSPFSPSSPDETKPSPATTRESWVPNRRTSDPPPPDDDSSDAMPIPSRLLLDSVILLKSLLLPLVAITYIVFCYTVHFKTVPVRSGGLFDDSPSNLAVIKSGVTSISIIIISLGLLPIRSLIADLRSEEFFRITGTRRSGAPLGYINEISSPSFGVIDSFLVVAHKYCSPYFLVIITTTILALVTSTLAPAALSVETALFDSDVQAFAVGAVKGDDFLNVSVPYPFLLQNLSFGLGQKASNLAWIENTLQVPYSFQVDDPQKHIVPAPISLPENVPARWLSDVVVMDPVCTWTKPRLLGNYTDQINFTYTIIMLDDVGLTFTILEPTWLIGDQSITIVTDSLSNTTDTGYPASGAMGWLLAQCNSNCSNITELNFDLSGLPTMTLTQSPSDYQLAFLVCYPNAIIETREVRSDGHGRLTVLDTSYHPKQGNLHPGQVNIMFSYALGKFGSDSGPQSPSITLGSESQATMLFGPNAANISGSYSSPILLRPLPGPNISETYARMMHSASKVFLNGAMSSVYVPGRVSVKQLIFASSLPMVVASTVLFVLLTVIMAVAHFRKDTPKFTLFSIAAALDRSEVPATLAQAKSDAKPNAREVEMVAPMGWKMVTLQRSELDRDVLHLD